MKIYLTKKRLFFNFIVLFLLILNSKCYPLVLFLNDTSSEITKLDIINSMQVTLFDPRTYDNYGDGSKTPFLVHILSIDCEVNLVVPQEIDIKKISHYKYNAFSIFFNNLVNLALSPLINSTKEKNQNRHYLLIINYIKMDISKIPELNIRENEPVFLYFNNILKKINLVYNNNNNNIEQTIIVSFFIQEKVKFKINISDDEKNITNMIVNYKENIVIKPESSKTYNIFITPVEDKINSSMIINIFQNHSSIFYLQKNQLNLGFIPIDVDYYYYYMEIFKGEEGEIMLFNKRQNGILISKIIKKNEPYETFPKLSEFPKYNEKDILSQFFLEFNLYNQKLSFNSSQTEKCEEKGCFLLITYYSNISKSLEINGTEFSLLSRIWDKEELIFPIINIPINEYIFGSYEQTTINIHYYSVFIPYETDSIDIEIHGSNILGYFHEGIVQINTIYMTKKTKKLFDKCQNKMIIKLNKKDIGLKSFKGKYFSFAFEKDINDNYSYYYFRILQKNPENRYMIYPLDTYKENFCETMDNKCYFLLKNENKISINKIFIYSFGNNDISYKAFYMNETNYYSKDLNLEKLNEIKEVEFFNGLLTLNLKTNEDFVLILIESNSKEEENLTVISSFYNQTISHIDIYSYQLIHLSENTFQQFSLIKYPSIEYRILINNTEGEGYICFNTICDNNNFIHLTEQKIYSFSISNKTNFFIYPKNNLIFNIKIIYENKNEAIKKLNYQYNYEEINSNKEKFPLIYMIKDLKYKGININFIFKFNSSNNLYNNLVIKGYGLDYSEISSIRDKNDIKRLDFTNGIKGKFDNITNSGTIELSNELIKTKYKETYKYLDDKFYMIIIENITSFNFKNLKNDIYVFSKDINKILLPINKYIRNSFNLLEDKNIYQKYYFEKENIINNEFILEFSSNYENIELTFNNITTNSTPKIIGGFKQYALSINSANSNDYYFYVTIKPANKLDLDKALKEVNIIIKYYNKEYKINTDYICSKTFILNSKNIKEKYSDYNLIINNKYKIINYPNDINYIYYLRLIKKSNILSNEELNTIALVSSDLLYIDHFNTTEINNEFSFNLNNLENNEKYIASFFIKVENIKEEEEKYYSITYEFKTENRNIEDNTSSIWTIIIILIFIIVLIFVFYKLFIIWRKMRIKNRNFEYKIKNAYFSSEINEDILNDSSDNIKESKDDENYFV